MSEEIGESLGDMAKKGKRYPPLGLAPIPNLRHIDRLLGSPPDGLAKSLLVRAFALGQEEEFDLDAITSVCETLIPMAERANDVRRDGSGGSVRRGEDIAPSLLNTAALAMLYACTRQAVPPPVILTLYVGLCLGSLESAFRAVEDRKRLLAKYRAALISYKQPGTSDRSIADQVGVDPKTLRDWKRQEDWAELGERLDKDPRYIDSLLDALEPTFEKLGQVIEEDPDK